MRGLCIRYITLCPASNVPIENQVSCNRCAGVFPEGEINVAGENLSRRDGIGIWDIESVTIEATSETQILAIEVAM